MDATLPELLAPAGGREQLEYALRFGADAVYLATERYGMRQRACNFLLDELSAAVRYAHERGARVYVTCNVMMHDNDLDDLAEWLERVDASGADALIIGDMGAFSLARHHAPHLALHVSTQASVSNSESAKVWHDLGASRIVLARELSLADIAHLRKGVPDDLELEAFVHGSMCMAYSGRCLISDCLTGRSALSGYCTQPCRWSYALEEEKRPGEFFPIEEDAYGSYLLNAEDLNMLTHLGDLVEAGVGAVKIEGRNKKAFYVATVVNAYRQVLDGADPSVFAPELECVSHRPYSTGFYYGPAHQAAKSDMRDQSCEFVGHVVDTICRADGLYECTVRIRNAFSVSDTLEVMSPGRPVRTVEVNELSHVGADADELELGGGPLPLERANRTMERGCGHFSVPRRQAPGFSDTGSGSSIRALL